jgi:hypothetical protein
MVSGTALHCTFGATLPDYEGKGLGFALRTTALEVARTRGFTCVLVEPAHPAAMHIWTKKLSGEVVATQDYSSFRLKDGSYPWSYFDGGEADLGESAVSMSSAGGQPASSVGQPASSGIGGHDPFAPQDDSDGSPAQIERDGEPTTPTDTPAPRGLPGQLSLVMVTVRRAKRDSAIYLPVNLLAYNAVK